MPRFGKETLEKGSDIGPAVPRGKQALYAQAHESRRPNRYTDAAEKAVRAAYEAENEKFQKSPWGEAGDQRATAEAEVTEDPSLSEPQKETAANEALLGSNESHDFQGTGGIARIIQDIAKSQSPTAARLFVRSMIDHGIPGMPADPMLSDEGNRRRRHDILLAEWDMHTDTLGAFEDEDAAALSVPWHNAPETAGSIGVEPKLAPAQELAEVDGEVRDLSFERADARAALGPKSTNFVDWVRRVTRGARQELGLPEGGSLGLPVRGEE